ncbi:MAG: AAA family ATPase [Anaerolineae bacterium]
MNDKLILPSLRIENYRPFRHLVIPHCGRVNLAVGKNNVGKSSLLEALRLYVQRGAPALIWRLLDDRDENLSRTSIGEALEPEDNVEYGDPLQDVTRLFFGTQHNGNGARLIRIGPVGQPRLSLDMAIDWVRAEVQQLRFDFESEGQEELRIPTLSIRFGGSQLYSLDLASGYERLRRPYPRPTEVRDARSVFIGANGLERSQIAQLWDKTALTQFEERVVEALRIIAPEVERITLIAERKGSSDRIPIVQITGQDMRIPLRSLGEGMNRMFGIALALVNAQDGLLLIDEIESGLHYSVQADMWRLVFETAHRLNVQVFATTHSRDCLEAFGLVANEDHQTEGVLIRLGRRGEDVVATLYEEEDLSIVTREQIEVR